MKTVAEFFQLVHTRLTECKVFLHNDFRKCFEIWKAPTELHVAFARKLRLQIACG